MEIAISTNISYCVGVQRTLSLVEELIRKNPEKTFYMLGEIVHNEFVIHDLESRGQALDPVAVTHPDPDAFLLLGPVMVKAVGGRLRPGPEVGEQVRALVNDEPGRAVLAV